MQNTGGKWWHRALDFVARLLLEALIAASVLSFAAARRSGRFRAGVVLSHATRWTAASLAAKMIALHARIAATAPSPARGEGADWFLGGSYRLRPEGRPGGDDDDGPTTAPAAVPARVRQVPGDGSCLFHAVAAGSLVERAAELRRADHPPMSAVAARSSALRARAAATLSRAGTELVARDGAVVAAGVLVEAAAARHGMTAEAYLADVRREGAWGGAPEIAALAHCLGRRIVVLEPGREEEEGDAEPRGARGSVCLTTTAQFGPPGGEPVYVLFANQQFPQDDRGKAPNHFLAVFPSD